MLSGGSAKFGANSLITEYSALVGDAVLRQRTRAAEHGPASRSTSPTR